MLVIREETRYGFSPLFLSHLRSLARQADNGFDGDDGGDDGDDDDDDDDGGRVGCKYILVLCWFHPCFSHVSVTVLGTLG